MCCPRGWTARSLCHRFGRAAVQIREAEVLIEDLQGSGSPYLSKRLVRINTSVTLRYLMPVHELAAALQRAALNAQKAGRLGPKQYGFVDDARRAATPYVIEIIGLNDDAMGWDRYAQEFQERREWCAEWCRNDWDIEPLRERG